MKPVNVLSNGTFWKPCHQVDSPKTHLNMILPFSCFCINRVWLWGWKTCGHRPCGTQRGLFLNTPLDLKAAWCRLWSRRKVFSARGNFWSFQCIDGSVSCENVFGLDMWALPWIDHWSTVVICLDSHDWSANTLKCFQSQQITKMSVSLKSVNLVP